jgi:hypothetical protein
MHVGSLIAAAYVRTSRNFGGGGGAGAADVLGLMRSPAVDDRTRMWRQMRADNVTDTGRWA